VGGLYFKSQEIWTTLTSRQLSAYDCVLRSKIGGRFHLFLTIMQSS